MLCDTADFQILKFCLISNNVIKPKQRFIELFQTLSNELIFEKTAFELTE